MPARINEDELHAILGREVEQFETQASIAISEEDEETVSSLISEITSWQTKLAEVFSTPSKQVRSLSRMAAATARKLALWLKDRPEPEQETTPEAQILEPPPSSETTPLPQNSTEPPPVSEAPPLQEAPQDQPPQSNQNPPATDAPPPKPEPSAPIPAAKTRTYRKL